MEECCIAPWFDRPLSIAGRILVEEEGRIVTKLLNIPRDLVMIPNVAIHMNREVNNGYAYNPQVDMIPLFGDETAKGGFIKLILREGRSEDGRYLRYGYVFYIAICPGLSGERMKNMYPAVL